MRKLFCILIFFSISNGLFSQTFEVEISTDSVLIGNYISITFSAINVQGDFEKPEFPDCILKGGPNMSTSFQSINGETTSTSSWTYHIEPSILGEITIPPAYLVTDSKTYETSPVSLQVHPNPEGIIIEPKNSFEFSLFDTFELPFGQPKKDSIQKQSKKTKRKLKRI